jgi:hypothetical protein
MEIIRDLLWLWILGAVSGAGYITWALFVRQPVPARASPQQITTRRTPVSPPVARPAGSGAASPVRSPTPLQGEHQRRGSAPTVKLAAAEPATDRLARTPSADDQAASDLFSGLSEAKAKADAAPPLSIPAAPQLAPPVGSVEKAVRLEERGFHVGAAKMPEAAAKPPVDLAGQNRTQTQELDDILKRIDAVLSESGAPASEATMANPQQPDGQATLPVPQPPPTERVERKATDPQQKLF